MSDWMNLEGNFDDPHIHPLDSARRLLAETQLRVTVTSQINVSNQTNRILSQIEQRMLRRL